MGQEVGWTLRFPVVRQVEALIRRSALPQVENLLHIEPDWGLETEERPEGLVLARLQRRPPAGGDDDPAA
ncbi:MAG: hypothetical protein ACOCVU_03800 [Desulfohalobiaceae bacterium]